MEANSGSRSHSCDLLDVSSQEGVTGARERGEADASILNRLLVKEAEFSVPDPVVLCENIFILTLEDALQLRQADRASSRSDHSTSVVTAVPNWELHAEELRVRVIAILLVDSVAVAVLVGVDDILTEHAHQDSTQLV